MTFDYKARIETLLSKVDSDVVAIVPGANMVYFTGLHFHLSERPTLALLSKEGVSFIIPELELSKLSHRPELDARPFAWSDATGYKGAFKEAVQELKLDNSASLAADGQTMRLFEWLSFSAAGVDVDNAQDVGIDLLNVRAIKTPEEIEAMRDANEISEKALQRVMDWVEVGMTEQQIAQKLEAEMNALGGEGLAFGSLVLTGEKSALPHGGTGTRQLQENEFLLFDFGAKKNDYPADITRTFCLGTPTQEMQKIYDAVRRANEAAHKISKPGVSCHDIDKAARDVIEDAGYGQYFTHRLGHGLGLSGHELPNIAPNNDRRLEVNMVFTIEPGIYVPEIGGVRIEDDVVVTENGIDSLTTYPRELSDGAR